MKLTVTMQCDNAAFEVDPGAEQARILRELAERLDAGEAPPFKLYDYNGNHVGDAKQTR